jgi:hypothetical protein
VMPIDPENPEIRAMRDRVFKGKVNTATMCAIFGRKPRTISRWIAHGLPHTRIGTEDWFDLDLVRDWIGASTSRQGSPRPPGRPKFYGTAGHELSATRVLRARSKPKRADEIPWPDR